MKLYRKRISWNRFLVDFQQALLLYHLVPSPFFLPSLLPSFSTFLALSLSLSLSLSHGRFTTKLHRFTAHRVRNVTMWKQSVVTHETSILAWSWLWSCKTFFSHGFHMKNYPENYSFVHVGSYKFILCNTIEKIYTIYLIKCIKSWKKS